jgi:DNA-binding NtrC family response regulator
MKLMQTPSSSDLKHQTAQIIVVENEELVLRFMEKSVRRAGFTHVHTAADWAGVSPKLSDIKEEDLVLVIDVALETENGVELASALLDERPAARVLLISGFIDEMLFLEKKFAGRKVAFLPKPFSSEQLATEINNLLDR